MVEYRAMRNGKGQFIKGATGNPNGRPKRADEQYLVDLWSEHGQKAFAVAVKGGEQWALKVLVDKLYANKRESKLDVTVRPEARPLLDNLRMECGVVEIQ
jgi:hypothetical protein